MSYPLVSIIVPSYNRAAFLSETIDSVLGQDYPAIELLVIDDGSSDNTVEILEGYGPRIRWYTQPNAGETRTVNRGFSLASGEVVSVLSSDDLLLPGAVSRAVRALQERPAAVATYSDWVWIDENGLILQLWKTPEHDLLEVLRRCECIPGPGAFIRREALEKVGGRDESLRFIADFDFWLRLALHGELVRIPIMLSAFREHQGSISVGGHGREMARETLAMVERYFSRPDLPDSVAATRRPAMASANFLAGCRVGNHLWLKLRYFGRAFFWIGNYRRGRVLVELAQSWWWGRALKRFLIARIRKSPEVGRHYATLCQVEGIK